MTGAFPSRPSSASKTAVARLSAALAASVLVHWAVMSSALQGMQLKAGAFHAEYRPIAVWLAPTPVPIPKLPAAPNAQARRLGKPADLSPGMLAHLQDGGPASVAEAPPRTEASDPVYYLARDLDDYPRPLAPLRIDRPARDGAGEVRLEILIDERGVVRDVVFASPAGPGGADEALRATLATTLFLPARKDGRPVRSRIMLSLTPGAAQREP